MTQELLSRLITSDKPMPPDPAHQLNRSACQADFTYTMVLDVVKIQDTGKREESVADDLEAVLRNIENSRQGSIAGYRMGLSMISSGMETGLLFVRLKAHSLTKSAAAQ